MYYKSKQLAKALIELDRDKRGQEDKIIENFVKFCKHKNIFQQILNIIKQLERENKRLIELNRCYIKTSQNLSQDTINQVKKYINIPKESETEIIQDGSLQGGFVAKYQGLIYDGSAKRQLEKLKDTLKSN